MGVLPVSFREWIAIQLGFERASSHSPVVIMPRLSRMSPTK